MGNNVKNLKSEAPDISGLYQWIADFYCFLNDKHPGAESERGAP